MAFSYFYVWLGLAHSMTCSLYVYYVVLFNSTQEGEKPTSANEKPAWKCMCVYFTIYVLLWALSSVMYCQVVEILLPLRHVICQRCSEIHTHWLIIIMCMTECKMLGGGEGKWRNNHHCRFSNVVIEYWWLPEVNFSSIAPTKVRVFLRLWRHTFHNDTT